MRLVDGMPWTPSVATNIRKTMRDKAFELELMETREVRAQGAAQVAKTLALYKGCDDLCLEDTRGKI